MGITSVPFQRLVSALKQSKKNLTVVEQCCGGLIQASILAQPGASSVFLGGSVVYNTRKTKPLLLNNDALHQSLTSIPAATTEKDYIQAKLDWTSQTSVAFCEALQTDYCIAEGGAAGPTFRPDDMTSGFAVIAIAAKGRNGKVDVVEQQVIRSHSKAHRQDNMRYFANQAATLATRVITGEKDRPESSIEAEKEPPMLDRATHLRSDTTSLEVADDALFVILQGRQILVRSDTPQTKLALLTQKDVSTTIEKHGGHRKTFLGLLHGKTPAFGIDLLDDLDARFTHSPTTTFVDTRTTAPLLEPLENEIALHATAYAQWQRHTRFCHLCSGGGPVQFTQGGTCAQCPACGALSWPRQDPSMIAAISSRDGKQILLAHSKRHPPKLHTVLAGFVEAGESVEAAVAREAYEETGIGIDRDSVRYVASQPWPFPQSIMLGFTAVADHEQLLKVDPNELVSAAWFTRSDVVKAAAVEGATMQTDVAQAATEKDPSLKLIIPPKGVIARKLIDNWLAGEI